MNEQRQEVRLEDPPVNVDGAWTAVYNLSLGGMCIVSLGPLAIGTRRSFKLVDRRTGTSCNLFGQVAWTSPVSSELTRVGIQWIDLDAETRRWLAGQMNAPAPAESGGAPWPFRKDEALPVVWL
jgi:hypothetical protein